MVGSLRGIPWGVALFLAYALLILTGIGLSLGPIVDQAVLVPITLTGVVAMALLAYTIFTITMVLQRKAAARGLAIALATLAIPAIPLAVLLDQLVVALMIAALTLLLYRGLRSPAAAAWLDQP